MLVQWAQADSDRSREFAMYLFEVISDCHLTSEQLTAYKDDFMNVFAKALSDRAMVVRIAALKAVTAFLTSIDESDQVMRYVEILPQLLATVVEALKANEDQGKAALEALNELTGVHPDIWKSQTSQLLNVISQIMLQKQFEDATRAAAVEVVVSVAREVPACLRKSEEVKTMFFPNLISMMMEVQEDYAQWASTPEED